MNIYYLGPKGSYSYIAAINMYRRSMNNLVSCKSFKEIIEMVLYKSKTLGIFPIENSITSNVHENIDYVFKNKLFIVGEIYILLNFNLLGLKGTKVNEIKKVYGHEKSIEQCSNFIKKYDLKSEVIASNSLGAVMVSEKKDSKLAALGASILADINDLEVIKNNVANEKNNKTRFVVISRNKEVKEGGKYDKATFIFKIKHIPGSLAKVLTDFAKYNANLTKIESRPIPGSEWEYNFWIDIEIISNNFPNIIEVLKQRTLKYRIVGFYKKGKIYKS